MRHVRIFVSSPADAMFEREIVDRLAQRVSHEFCEVANIEIVRWEKRIYGAHDTFQNLITPADSCDLVIGIFRHRLGTPLPDGFPRMPPDPPYHGDPYASGTAFEILSAVRSRVETQSPDIVVFRLRSPGGPPTNGIDDRSNPLGTAAQWEALQAFFERYFKTASGEFLRAYQSYTGLDHFREQVERLLRQWMEQSLAGTQDVTWPVDLKGSPFRSLQPFEAKHAAVYFGRDRKVAKAMDGLIRSAEGGGVPLLFIIGASGAGKSSLMRAGMAPRLTKPGRVPGVAGWRVAVVRIGNDDPFVSLAKALLVSGDGDDEGGFGRALPELGEADAGAAEDLPGRLAGPDAAAAPIRRALAGIAARHAAREGATEAEAPFRLLLLLDQFESLFTSDIDERRRAEFAAAILALCRTGDVWAIATLRADQYHHLLQPGPLIQLKDNAAQYDLASPGPSELTDIIRRSAAAAGLTYDRDEDGEMLDDVLLRDATGENTLPLLQFALERLFREREQRGDESVLTFASYRGMGGLDGALTGTGDAALRSLDREAVAALEPLLRRLVVRLRTSTSTDDGRGALTIRPALLSSVARNHPSERLIASLVDARILVTSTEKEGGRGDVYLSIAHQRVIDRWEVARRHVADLASFFRDREEVAIAVETWKRRRRTDDLIQSASQLEGAQKLMRLYGDEFDDLTRQFVRASTRHAVRKQTVAWSAAAALGAIAVVAIYFYLQSDANLATAQSNYMAASDTVDQLISGVAGELKNVYGIKAGTAKKALKVIEKAVDKLQVGRGLGDVSAISRTRSNMLFNFAAVYQAEGDEAQRKDQAERALDLRRRLVGLSDDHADAMAFSAHPKALWDDYARSLDQQGDILRDADPAAARDSYGRALRIREHFADPTHREVLEAVELSRSWTRLGDIDAKSAGPKEARADYMAALTVAAEPFLGDVAATRRDVVSLLGPVPTVDPAMPQLRREVTWSLRKLGDIEIAAKRPASAVPFFADAVCLRRVIVMADVGDELAKRDLAFSLDSLGKAQAEVASPDAHDAFIESYMLRDELAEADRGNFLYGLETVDTLLALGDLYKRQNAWGRRVVVLEAARRRIEGLMLRAEGSVQKDSARARKIEAMLGPELESATFKLREGSAGMLAPPPEPNIDTEVSVLRTALGRSNVDPNVCRARVAERVRMLVDQVGSIPNR